MFEKNYKDQQNKIKQYKSRFLNKPWVLFSISVLITFILVLILAWIKYRLNDEKEYFNFLKKDLATHFDITAIAIAIMTFLLGLYIADMVNKKTIADMKEHNQKITSILDNFEDATRKILYNADDILDSVISMLSKLSNKDSDKLYVLNYTIAFGLIHTYNKVLIENISSSKTIRSEDGRWMDLNFEQSLEYLLNKYEDYTNLIKQKASIIKDCKIRTYNNNAGKETLTDDFIDKFIENNKANMFNYTYDEGHCTIDNKFTDDNKKELIGKMTKQHNDIFSEITNERYTRGYKEEWRPKTAHMPLQLFLTSYKEGKEQKYECLIIFVGENNLDKSGIIAISTKLEKIYSPFKTMFDGMDDNDKKN